MALHDVHIEPEDIDGLVIAWLNMLQPHEMDRFFWDYPGPDLPDYRKGYGLGIRTAGKIVERRRRIGGFRTIAQVRGVPGLGKDKLYDMRCQAREALTMADHLSLPRDPRTLWLRLMREGPGVSLLHVIEALKKFVHCSLHYNRAKSDALMKETHISIPFVSLSQIRHRKEAGRFDRVRVDQWAFAVYGSENHWRLKLSFVPGQAYTTLIEKVH